MRIADDAQYENRLRQWDYDIITAVWGQSLSPGNEQRGFWSSKAADQPGSRNLVGIKNPAVDALIERLIFATSRDDLVAATKALDRVLLWNDYVVPQWTYGKIRSARWDRYRPSRPAAEIRLLGIPDRLVVGRGEGVQGRDALVIGLSRRKLLGFGAGAVAAGAVGSRLSAQPAAAAERHGMSAFGDLKYPADFPHFDYADPKAPKGGAFSQIGPGTIFNQNQLTFNSLNSYILRGDAAQGMELTFATLMVRAEDEPDAMYGLAARVRERLARWPDLSLRHAARGALP